MLRNGINTRTAKAGDSVYFETAYPIAQNNRIVIPMGSFVRGKILESKRPGLIKGRGEFRMVLEQMTFPNGYTVSLGATPASADRDGREGVDAEGKIIGPSGSGHDKMLLLATTAGGAYIGTLAGTAANGAPVKGALIGGGAGAAAGLVVILLTRGPEAELPRGTMMDVVFDHALVLDADHLPASDPGRLSQPLVPAVSPQETHRRESPARRTLPGLPFPFLRF
jgi:type IV secretion system protein VirB10